MSDITYNQLSVNKQLKSNILKKGFTHPTPIQKESIPSLIKGKDLVGIANTGTGKTAAFLIPILERYHASKGRTKALIVVPTRELALQVEKEFQSLAFRMNVNSSCFIGGVNINRDIARLKRNQDLIIATPGRLLDLINRKLLSIARTEVLVLDEFDRMLDMGFLRDVQKIIGMMHNRKQSILFSATIDKTQEKYIKDIVNNEVRVKVDSGIEATDTVDQDIIRILPVENKFDKFKDLISQDGFNKVLVFAETKRMVNNLAKKLNTNGYKADTIHGNKSQNYRVNALEKFRKGKVSILVATDVAARGIDINDITHVINYQLPMSMDSYIHRIGRTGRAGNIGQAYTFID